MVANSVYYLRKSYHLFGFVRASARPTTFFLFSVPCILFVFQLFFSCVYCLILYLFQVTFFACSFLSWGARDSRLFSVWTSYNLRVCCNMRACVSFTLSVYALICMFFFLFQFRWCSYGYSFASWYTIPFENVGFTCMLTRDFCVLSLHSIRLLSSPCGRARSLTLQCSLNSAYWILVFEHALIVVVHFVQISHSDRDSISNWERESVWFGCIFDLVVYMLCRCVFGTILVLGFCKSNRGCLCVCVCLSLSLFVAWCMALEKSIWIVQMYWVSVHFQCSYNNTIGFYMLTAFFFSSVENKAIPISCLHVGYFGWLVGFRCDSTILALHFKMIDIAWGGRRW